MHACMQAGADVFWDVVMREPALDSAILPDYVLMALEEQGASAARFRAV